MRKPYLVSSDIDDVARYLAEDGVRFEQWQLTSQSEEGDRLCRADEILNRYRADIEGLKNECDYKFVDVISVKKTDSFLSARRNHFLSEHTHSGDEVRLFLSGTVLIYLHINARIHILQCERGDFLSIPKGVKHWLDMGPTPDFRCIRWFNSEESLKNQLTGSCIAESAPRWETILGNTCPK
ncbi:MAG: 1,2-dihydroxy-3-keto-5-methylthiopentene dioxygenase [Oleiphilaceae bacterium]|jgi:1,2-dihydroxy-3-keto-5-methylthiopentene dioxygenase